MYEEKSVEILEKLGIQVRRFNTEVRVVTEHLNLLIDLSEISWFTRVATLVKGSRVMPFSLLWLLTEDSGAIRLVPHQNFSSIGDFVQALSLGHSMVKDRRVENGNADPDMCFGRPGNYSIWDVNENTLERPLLPLHQSMQPQHIFGDIPEWALLFGRELVSAESEYPIGSIEDWTDGKRYVITSKIRDQIFMSGDQVYGSKDLSNYFSAKYGSLARSF